MSDRVQNLEQSFESYARDNVKREREKRKRHKAIIQVPSTIRKKSYSPCTSKESSLISISDYNCSSTKARDFKLLKHKNKRFPMLKHTRKSLPMLKHKRKRLLNKHNYKKNVWGWTLDIQSVVFSIQISYKILRL